MKAAYIREQGSIENLIYGDLPEPEVTAGDVKIRVRACAMNRLDVFTRAGIRGTGKTLSSPQILGCDVAGEIVEVGSNVRSRSIGERVVLYPLIPCDQCQWCALGDTQRCDQRGMLGITTNGGYAEYAITPEANAYPLADHIGFDEAAALPTTFLPVWDIILQTGKLRAEQTLLIPSASSGVGVAAIQTAKNVVGATVIATTSTRQKADRAVAMGADHVILYTEESVRERVLEITKNEGVDVVVDHVGSNFWDDGIACLRKGGKYGVCGVSSGYRAELHLGQMFLRQIHVFGVNMGSRAAMEEIVRSANNGIVRGSVYGTFPLAEVQQAHRLMESQDFFGKIVLVP